MCILQTTVRGYAISGGGRGIERVDLSIDGGKTWIETLRYQKRDAPYVSDDIKSDKWAWVFFEATVDLPPYAEIVVKAVCLLILSVTVAACFRPVCLDECGLPYSCRALCSLNNTDSFENIVVRCGRGNK